MKITDGQTGIRFHSAKKNNDKSNGNNTSNFELIVSENN